MILQLQDIPQSFKTSPLSQEVPRSQWENRVKGGPLWPYSGRLPAATDRCLAAWHWAQAPTFFLVGLFFLLKSSFADQSLTWSTKIWWTVRSFPGLWYAVVLPVKCPFCVVFVVALYLYLYSANTLTNTSGSI